MLPEVAAFDKWRIKIRRKVFFLQDGACPQIVPHSIWLASGTNTVEATVGGGCVLAGHGALEV